MGKKADVDLAWNRVERQAIDMATAIIQSKMAEKRADDPKLMPIMVDLMTVNMNIQVRAWP